MPIIPKATLFNYFILFIFSLGLVFPFNACAMQNLPFSRESTTSKEYSDTLRALMVFTQFKDDTYPGDPNVFERQWPLTLPKHTLPPFARALLAPDNTPPFPDSSLTDYFYQQSLGKFVLFGQPYDSVLISLHDESHYHRPKGSYGTLTKELLDRIDAHGFDFSEFDQNRDGYLDYVFIVVRGDSKRDAKRFVWTGASCLDGRCTGSMVGGSPLPPTRIRRYRCRLEPLWILYHAQNPRKCLLFPLLHPAYGA